VVEEEQEVTEQEQDYPLQQERITQSQ